MNILIISDIHIGNYPNYETYKYERLEFYLTYAKRIIEIAQENNCKVLFIAGDFMDAPVNSPEVLRIAKQVINIWESYFDKIYYILGQHDLKSKNYDDPNVDKYSITNVLAGSKMRYSDHSIIREGGRDIAMMNFTPEHDLSWIPNKVDLFISHWTINTNGFGEDNHSSDKFTLGIAGDIHYPCSDRNLHSVGISVPRYLGDSQSGTSVVVDLDTLEWKRVENDLENKLFTRYIKTSNWEEEGPSEEKLDNGISPKIYKIYRPAEETLITQRTLKEFSDDRVKDINEIIQKSVAENNLEKIHEKVLAQNPLSQSIDLNFKLLTLTINNVRSIDEYVWDLTDKKGVYQIVGENGSGKSSLMWSLNYALRGGLDIRDQIREGETQASVYLKLEYQGKVYGIYRGTDGVWLDIDGEYQSFGGKRDTENAIYEQLPFINYLDSFFFDDEAVSIMGSYSSDRRIELLSTYYRIDVLQNYYDTCTQLLQELNAQSKQSWNDYYAEEASYNSKKQALESKKEELSHLLREVLERDLKELTKQYKKRVSLESKNKGMTESEYEELKEFNKSKLLGFESKLSKNQRKLKDIKELLKDKGIHHTEEEISEISDKHLKAYEVLMEIKAEIKSIKSRLENFSEITCPNCGTIIGLVDLQQVSKKELEDKLEKLRKEFHDGKEAYESEEDRIDSMKSEEESYKSYQSALKDESTVNELIDSLENQIKTCNKDLEDIEIRYKESLDLLKGKSSKEIEEEMNSIRASIFQLNELDKQEKDLLEYEASGTLEKFKEKAEEVDKDIEDHQLYQQLFSNNGNLYKLILNSILERFNSDSFRYEAVSEWYRGKEYTDITGFYKNYKMKDFRPYYKLSRGQKTLVDLDFIRNLITNAGVVVFDEILKFLSPANQIEGIRIINEMNPPLKIITNQSENSLYVDKCLNLRYNGATTEFYEG
jgi:predicted MPP superfamily phosphohydrolase/ABC-type molybdenum transport system ATPase subunit/photorepair protein PhrA